MYTKATNKISDKFAEEMAEMPEFSLSSDALPQIKTWKIGKNYVISLKVKMTKNGLGKTPYGFPTDNKEKAEKEQYGTFKILSVEDESNEDESGETEYDPSKPMNPLNHPLKKGSKSGKNK